jgi:hypothetical protein
MITLEQAKNLSTGVYLLIEGKRWKVNGKVKTWKRSPELVKVPVKHGLYTYDYVTEEHLHLVTLEKLK